MSKGRRYPALADESGQVLVLAAAALVLLLAVTGFALDFGHAYLVQRQLQSGVDAAALAGAQHLPVAAEVIPVAEEYGPSAGAKNPTTTVNNATTTVTMRCVQAAPGCQQANGNFNAVRVDATAPVRTLFGRVIGINKITVRATATACSPCSAKPLDIMLVLDRTGSMCQHSNGTNDPNCTDLNNAKNGIRTFLSYMDPNLDWVGLSAFPPVLNPSFIDRCPQPQGYRPWTGNNNLNPPPNNLDGRRYAYDARWPSWDPPPNTSTWSVYTIVDIVHDFAVQANGTWVPNPSSPLNYRLGCVGGNGTTQYANAIADAQNEFGETGRGNVQDVIIFLSDGAANTTPRDMPNGLDTSYYRQHPCHAGVAAAGQAKANGTIIYSIGYDLNGAGTDYENCKLYPSGANDGSITAWDAIRAIATDPCAGKPIPPCPNFYNKPEPGDLRQIFTRIAQDLQKPAARLIDDNTL